MLLECGEIIDSQFLTKTKFWTNIRSLKSWDRLQKHLLLLLVDVVCSPFAHDTRLSVCAWDCECPRVCFVQQSSMLFVYNYTEWYARRDERKRSCRAFQWNTTLHTRRDCKRVEPHKSVGNSNCTFLHLFHFIFFPHDEIVWYFRRGVCSLVAVHYRNAHTAYTHRHDSWVVRRCHLRIHEWKC